MLGQVRTEAQRHEARRQQTSERFDALLNGTRAGTDLREAHDQLVLQAKRAALMDAQLEVLEGKQKVLRRFADYLGRTMQSLAGGMPLGSPEEAGAAALLAGEASSRSVMEAQEMHMARQMHDDRRRHRQHRPRGGSYLTLWTPRRRARGAPPRNGRARLKRDQGVIFDVRPMVCDLA